MATRILLLASGSGGGHIQAAKNVGAALVAIAPEVETVQASSYDFLHPFKRWQYTTAWEYIFQYFGPQYGWARRYLGDTPWAQRMIRRSFRVTARRFARWLEVHGPFDAVVATQPHASGITSFAKLDPRWSNLYLAQCWTDFWFYELYYWPRVDRFFATADEFRAHALRAHPSAAVTASGVPIHPGFAALPDKREVRVQFGLPDDGRPVVLVTRGSFGYDAAFTLRVLDALGRARLPVTIVANAGKREALVAQMRETLRAADPAHEPHVLGWVDKMWDLLAVSDVVVGKPGGLSVAEALARGVPFVAFRPIPGQEVANVRFLEEHRVGTLAKTPGDVVAAVRRYVEHPAELTAAQDRARALGHPNSATVTAQQVLADLAARVAGNPQKRG